MKREYEEITIVANAMKRLRGHCSDTLKPSETAALGTCAAHPQLLIVHEARAEYANESRAIRRSRSLSPNQPSMKKSKLIHVEMNIPPPQSDFERGRHAAYEELLGCLIPEALMEVERETRLQCTREAVEDARAWRLRQVPHERLLPPYSAVELSPYMSDAFFHI